MSVWLVICREQAWMFKSVLFVLGLMLSFSIATVSVTTAQNADERYRVFSLAYSPDGTKIAVGGGAMVCNYELTKSEKYAIRILESETGELIQSLIGHNCYVNSASWDPNGTQLASSSGDGSIRVWNTATGQQISLYGSASIGHAANSFSDAVWIDDVSQVAFLNKDVFFIDPTNGSLVGNIRITAGKVSLALSVDGAKFAIGSFQNEIEIWTRTGQFITKFEADGIYSISWSPDVNKLVTTNGNEIRVYTASTGQLEQTLPAHPRGTYVVSWSPDGAKIASGGGDDVVRIWDAATGELLTTLNYSGPVYAIAWHPNSRELAYGGNGTDLENLVEIASLDFMLLPTATPTSQ
jgi:WD40 repeat protein